MNIVERYKKPTPKFFKLLRNIGITLASIGGIILTAPIALPALVLTIGGYLAVVGAVVTTVSQAVVSDTAPKKEIDESPNQ